MTPAPRIYRVTYVSSGQGGHRRKAVVYVKVPYGGAYAMAEVLTRMVTVGQITRFEIAVCRPSMIYRIRSQMQRWLPALTETSQVTGVDWTA